MEIACFSYSNFPINYLGYKSPRGGGFDVAAQLKDSLSANKHEPQYLWSYRIVNIQRVSIYSASPFGLERDNMLHPSPLSRVTYLQ